jgi:hypothetical protein
MTLPRTKHRRQARQRAKQRRAYASRHGHTFLASALVRDEALQVLAEKLTALKTLMRK